MREVQVVCHRIEIVIYAYCLSSYLGSKCHYQELYSQGAAYVYSSPVYRKIYQY